MTEHTHDDTQTTEPGGKPSQAEGERRDSSVQQSATENPAGKSSQAEGSREETEEELEQR